MSSKPIVGFHAKGRRPARPAATCVAQVPHTPPSSIATRFRIEFADMPTVGAANTRLQPRTGEAEHA